MLAHAQGADLEEVVVNINYYYCKGGSMEAVTGDDWQENGYLWFGSKLAVHLTRMDAAGRAVQ